MYRFPIMRLAAIRHEQNATLVNSKQRIKTLLSLLHQENYTFCVEHRRRQRVWENSRSGWNYMRFGNSVENRHFKHRCR